MKYAADLGKVLSGGIVGGVLGYLLKTQIDHRLAIARNNELVRVTDFNKAASIFRAAFVKEIFLLRANIISGNEVVHKIITKEAMIRHEKAKIIFEPFVATRKNVNFNAAWDKYKHCEYNFLNSSDDYHPDNITGRKEFSQFYLNHIEQLFVCAAVQ